LPPNPAIQLRRPRCSSSSSGSSMRLTEATNPAPGNLTPRGPPTCPLSCPGRTKATTRGGGRRAQVCFALFRPDTSGRLCLDPPRSLYPRPLHPSTLGPLHPSTLQPLNPSTRTPGHPKS
jgi:hypothetical protein